MDPIDFNAWPLSANELTLRINGWWSVTAWLMWTEPADCLGLLAPEPGVGMVAFVLGNGADADAN